MTEGLWEPGAAIRLLEAVAEGRWALRRIHGVSTRSGAAGADAGRRCLRPHMGGGEHTEGFHGHPTSLPWSQSDPPPPVLTHPGPWPLSLSLRLSPRLPLQPASRLASDAKQPGCRSCPPAAFAAVPPLTRVLMRAALRSVPRCKGRQT